MRISESRFYRPLLELRRKCSGGVVAVDGIGMVRRLKLVYVEAAEQ